MNFSPDVVEQVLWLGLYLFIAAFTVGFPFAAVIYLIEYKLSKPISPYIPNPDLDWEKYKLPVDLIPTGGINSDVEREKAKLVIQGKEVEDE